MIVQNTQLIIPRRLKLDASTVCQLKCPSCPTASGETGKRLGVGYLKFNDFKKIIDENPNIAHIELSNWGEVFLNKDIIPIMKYAYKRNVALQARNGANMNTLSDELLEALVKYKFRFITCSIDGASQETYVQYRVNGSFERVIANIKKINEYKKKYNSPYPRMKWQFVAFGHNEHEIDKARTMAKDLGMQFVCKLNWGDLYGLPFTPIKNKDQLRKDSRLGVADREEYHDKYKEDYIVKFCCTEIWRNPQINIDGRVLGCPVNYWGDFGNAFTDGVKKSFNNEKINYARDMLMGKKEAREDIPCSTCKIYKKMKKNKEWVTEEEARVYHVRGRNYNMLENKVFGVEGTKKFARFIRDLKGRVRLFKQILFSGGKFASHVFSLMKPTSQAAEGILQSGIHSLRLPLKPDPVSGWQAYPKIMGITSGIERITGHASSLMQYAIPHPPAGHREEEIMMLLSGEAELILPEVEGENGTHVVPFKPGQFAYYPAGFKHTLQALSEEPIDYVMFKWYSKPQEKKDMLKFGMFDINDSLNKVSQELDYHCNDIFTASTGCLKRFHCHASVLPPGADYKSHIDHYDVAIVVLEGELETLGQRAKAHDIIFYAAGEPHGMYNPTNTTAKYLVFEFHGHKRGIMGHVIQKLKGK